MKRFTTDKYVKSAVLAHNLEMGKNQIQHYINNFRRRLAHFLRPDIGISCRVIEAIGGGAVLIFEFGPDVENDDVYAPTAETIGEALRAVEQRAFGGNLGNVSFGGTNTILEGNRVIFIKDNMSATWSDKQAAKDAESIVFSKGPR